MSTTMDMNVPERGTPERDLDVSIADHVATVTIRRAPNNHVDFRLLRALRDALRELDADRSCRCVVLASEGKHFCAGADFSAGSMEAARSSDPAEASSFYKMAADLFRARKPMVAAVQGAAIGAGLGLSLVADFRVTCPEARFSANFTRLGFHPGFGLTHTLPRLVGQQAASLLFLTGRRLPGDAALAMGLVDALVPREEVLDRARELAREVATSAPLAVVSTRATLRQGLADAVERATEREFVEQEWLGQTDDFQTGIAASRTRAVPAFKGG